MSVKSIFKLAEINEVPQGHFLVVHPLDDFPEDKIDTANLGPMAMTSSVKLSLVALRTYLVLMMVLVLYHVIDLAGATAAHRH